MNSTAILAAFVTPALAAAGAAAMAAPILIHLLARRRFKRIRWAAMDFLIDAERRNRRRIRMEEWILLALRCLAVLLIGLMAARPFVSEGVLASVWGGSRRTERVVLLDDSFSMGLETSIPGEPGPFHRAKSAVETLIESFQRETPDDAVTILRMSAPGNPVAAGAYLGGEEAESLLARVGALSPSQHALDLGGVFKAVAESLGKESGSINAAVYVLSDFQRRDWTGRTESGPGASGDQSVLEPLRAWASKDRTVRLFLVNVGEVEAANLAVVGLKLQGGHPVAGTSAMVQAKVANFGSRPASRLALQVGVGQRAQGSKALDELAPFQEASLNIEAGFLRPGHEEVRVELPRDALPIDNSRYAVAEVVSAVRVLIVNGEPSADEYEDEVALLRTALRPEGEIFSGHEVVMIDEAALESTNLAGYHAVILANVYRVSEVGVEALERFARGGGGVMLFLGDQIDAGAYNQTMYRDGRGLLPASLGDAVRTTEAARLVIVDRLHPALGAVHGAEDPLGVGQIPFFEFVATQPFKDSASDGEAPAEPNASDRPATTELESPSNDALVLARFNDPDQSPAIVERAFGEGRVMLLTTTADKEWNGWADHPTYLPLITELLRHAARGSGRLEDYRVGKAIEMDLGVGVYGPDVVVRSPGYPDVPDATVNLAPPTEEHGASLRWEHTDAPGVYQFVLRPLEGGEIVRLAAVNVDPTESNLTMATDAELRRTMDGLQYTYVKGLDRLASVTSEAKTELWTPALLAAMLVLMSEQSLAWWWGRKR